LCGVRVTLNGKLANARCVPRWTWVRDAVTPADRCGLPRLAGRRRATLRTYPVYTVVAEKLHAIVLGMVNSRLKDYLDLVVMMERAALDEPILALAVAATFQRRGTGLPNALPVGLSDEFALDPTRIALWQSLLKKNDIVHRPLVDVVMVLRLALWPAVVQAAALRLSSP
jgi:hypothetical protein